MRYFSLGIYLLITVCLALPEAGQCSNLNNSSVSAPEKFSEKSLSKDCPKGLTIETKKLLESEGYKVEQDEYCNIRIYEPINKPVYGNNNYLGQNRKSEEVAKSALKAVAELGAFAKHKAKTIENIVATYYND